MFKSNKSFASFCIYSCCLSISLCTLKYKNYILTTPSIVCYFAHIAEECSYAVYFWKTGKLDAAYQWIALNNIIGCGREQLKEAKKNRKRAKILFEKMLNKSLKNSQMENRLLELDTSECSCFTICNYHTCILINT